MWGDDFRLGVVDKARARRLYVEAHRARIKPHRPAKVHHITVNLATGERKVESEIVAAMPAAAIEPPKSSIVCRLSNPSAGRGTPSVPSVADLLTSARIVDAACRIWELERYRFDDRTREHRVSYARFAVGLFIKQHLQWSSTKVGRRFNVDHSSALHWFKRGASLLESDPLWCRRYRALEAELLPVIEP